jgi:hypothetical protein
MKNECKVSRMRFVSLVNKFIEHSDNLESLQYMITELDFRKRSSLEIIMKENLPQMFNHSKIQTILEEVWNGIESFKCNGKYSDFSFLISRFFEDPIVPSIFQNNSKTKIKHNFTFRDIVYGTMRKAKLDDELYWW